MYHEKHDVANRGRWLLIGLVAAAILAGVALLLLYGGGGGGVGY